MKRRSTGSKTQIKTSKSCHKKMQRKISLKKKSYKMVRLKKAKMVKPLERNMRSKMTLKLNLIS